MSTFDGIVKEFPGIRIDYFRTHPGTPPPLACFLSHIHSDHLCGLESLKSPFVYCSPATRRLLLRMEKHPHRMNFSRGILEVRKQHWRHLQLVLKAIPLQTPTELELSPQVRITVTLFDANHCPGATMFLVEGDGKAVLYTGDVRAEPWWVSTIVRSPVLIPFTLGEKRLDCIYLDTTFATKDDVYQDFPEKAVGLRELVRKVKACPSSSIFYFRAWTLGYEDVWVALSAALKSKIHVDDYQNRLYRSLAEDRDGISVAEAPALVGFQAGNHYHTGCLTANADARVHSCEPGTECHAMLSKNKDVVWITPIITRLKDGSDVYEIGAGGGGGDLYQQAEVNIADQVSWQGLQDLCAKLIDDPRRLANTLQQLALALKTRKSGLSLTELGLDPETEITLQQLVERMASAENSSQSSKQVAVAPDTEAGKARATSDTIHFPYSRHSSYNELRHLVSAFRPKDICPCTVDEETWTDEVSMQELFGDLCSGVKFEHDKEIREVVKERRKHEEPTRSLTGNKKRKREENQETQQTEPSDDVYETAEDSTGATDREASRKPALRSPPNHVTSKSNGRSSPTVQEAIAISSLPSTNPPLADIRAAFRALNGDKDTISAASVSGPAESASIPLVSLMEGSDSQRENNEEESDPGEGGSELSVSASFFDSQQEHADRMALKLDGANGDVSELVRQHDHQDEARERRLYQIQEAYRVVRSVREGGDSRNWNDLILSSAGRRGHTEPETEL